MLVEKNEPGGRERGGKSSDFSRVNVRQKVEKEMCVDKDRDDNSKSIKWERQNLSHGIK